MAHPAKPIILFPNGFVVHTQTGFPQPPPQPGPRQAIGPQLGGKDGQLARQPSTPVKMMKGLFKIFHSSRVDTPGGATTGVLPNDVDMKCLPASPVSPQHSAIAPRVPVVAPQPNPQAPQHAVQGPPTAIQTPLPTVQTPRPAIKWVAPPPNGPQPMQRGPMPNLNSILDTDPFFYSYGDPDMTVRMLTAPYLIRRLREEFRDVRCIDPVFRIPDTEWQQYHALFTHLHGLVTALDKNLTNYAVCMEEGVIREVMFPITLVRKQYEEMARNPTHARLGSPWMLDMVNYANEVKESFRQIVEQSIPPQSRMPTPRPVHAHQPAPPSTNMNMHAHPGPWDSQNYPPARVPIVQPSNRQW